MSEKVIWEKVEVMETTGPRTQIQLRMFKVVSGTLEGRPCRDCKRAKDCRVEWANGKEMGECFAPDGTIAVQDERPL